MATIFSSQSVKKYCRNLTGIASLRWRHNGRDSVSNHQPHDCLLNRLSRRRSKKTTKLRVTGLCAGNSPVTGEFPAEFPAQRASKAENVSTWWRPHDDLVFYFSGELWFGVTLAVLIDVISTPLRTTCVAFYLFLVSSLGGLAPFLVSSVQEKFLDVDFRSLDAFRSKWCFCDLWNVIKHSITSVQGNMRFGNFIYILYSVI